MSEATPVLEMRGISKRFGATQALEDVSLQLRAGEIHALLGENGAGKSTLIKIMTGLYVPDEGSVLVDGDEVRLRSSADAQRLGVAAIYQEPMIFPDLDVAENIFIGHRDRGKIVDGGSWSARRPRSSASSTCASTSAIPPAVSPSPSSRRSRSPRRSRSTCAC